MRKDSDIASAVHEYFEGVVADEVAEGREARLRWRLSCFESGLRLAGDLETRDCAVHGRRVLDVAAAWGGHGIAFAHKGAEVYACDLNDHAFPRLRKFSAAQRLNLRPFRASCEALPFADASVDIVLALELIEHIESVEAFAKEAARITTLGGVYVVSTPPRLRSFIEGEPHYGIRGLTLLPFRWQPWVAKCLFRRSYPYPIRRQYSTASQVIAPFAQHGFEGIPETHGRAARLLRKAPTVLRFFKEVYWGHIILVKPIQPAKV